MHSDRKPYDLRWALLVAATFLECYPAGGELLRSAFGYSPDYPAKLILTSNAQWERWKSIVKTWDRVAREDGEQPTEVTLSKCIEMQLPEQLQLIARARQQAGGVS